MKILAVETSCDETAAAIVEDGTKILAYAVASSLPLHAKTGGVIPETAAREQSKAIIPVINSVVKQSRLSRSGIDALAVTFGPGLIGSLIVGVETIRALGYVWDKTIVPVNHLIGHLYSAWLERGSPPKFPLVALIVSGGHTELLYVEGHDRYKHLGGTRDDAAGEAFDKIARSLGLGYPGGPAIEKTAVSGDPSRFGLPRPLSGSTDYDFSFSGLKTAAVIQIGKLNKGRGASSVSKSQISDFAASFQEAVVDSLVIKTVRAAEKFKVENIVLGGGVAANKRLRERLKKRFNGNLFTSSRQLSVDNAAMIGAAAFFNYKPKKWGEISADASILF